MRPTGRAADVRVFWALTALGSLLVAWRSRELYYFLDDWMILGGRRDVLSDEGVAAYVLRPHNDHLMGGVVVVQHLVTGLFGLTSYWPWTCVVLTWNVTIAVVLRRAIRAVGVPAMVAAIAAPMVYLWASMPMATLWALEVVFGLGAALVVAHLLLTVDPRSRVDRRDVVGACASAVAVFFHSAAVIGLPMVVAVVLLRGRSWSRAAVAAVPGALFGLWLVTYGRTGPVWASVDGAREPQFEPATGGPVAGFLRFVVDMWTTPLAPLLPDVIAAPVLVALCVVGLRAARDTPRVLCAAWIVHAALFTLVVAAGRSGIAESYEVAFSHRYALVLVVLLMPAVLRGASALVAPAVATWSARTVLAVGTVLTCAVVAVNLVSAPAVSRTPAATREAIVALASVPDLDRVPGDTRVLPFLDLNVDHLRRLMAADLLPTSPPPTPNVRLATELRLFVRAEARLPGDLDAVLAGPSGRLVRRDDGCVEVRAGRAPIRIVRDESVPMALTFPSGPATTLLSARRDDAVTRRVPVPSTSLTNDVRVDTDPSVEVLLHVTDPVVVCGVDVADGP